MKKRNQITAAAAAIVMASSSAATADGKLGAFAVGAALGAIVTNEVKNNRQRQAAQQQQAARQQQAAAQRSYANSYQRQQNREVQSALNAFNFPVGGVDGQLGPKSRSAIANYQAYMGYQPTGYLEEYQRIGLINAHQRLEAGGGAAYPEVVANEGTQGLLKAFADPTYANRYRNNGVQNAAVQNNNAPAPISPPAAAPAFAPLNLAAKKNGASMASHCELVAGMTQANQGVVLASNVTDPNQALGEQFCEARAFAITQSQSVLSQASTSEDEVAAACTQITDLMQPATAQITTGDVKLVATQAQQIAMSAFNSDMESAAVYGDICLGLGYRRDDADMALGAATLLLATGKMPYAEVMGHHLRWGFGTQVVPAASNAWYEAAVSSMTDGGAQPVFLPSKTAERNAVIQASISGAAAQAGNAGSLSLPPLNLNNN